MVKFLISHPRFACVISIAITIAGLLALLGLPIAQYPEIAPPEIVVSANFPGASSEMVRDTVGTIIENEVNGVEGMIYMKSSSANSGLYDLTITFEVGSDADKAQVLVQNRVNKALPLLPEEVKRQGIFVEKLSSSMVLALAIHSEDPKHDGIFLSNYTSLYIKDVLARVPGVGKAQILGEQAYSMRLWLDPVKMTAKDVTVNDVVAALRDQNAVASGGQIGTYPSPTDQPFQYTVQLEGRLRTEQQFEDVIIKGLGGGSNVYLRDIGRAELGAAQYMAFAKLNQGDASVVAVYQQPGSNALDVAKGVIAELDRLQAEFPQGLHYSIPYDTTQFVKAAIYEVFETLIIAVLLVIFVTYLFLQDWRSTLIPTLTIPVSLIGTFGVMSLFGYSINMLTLFGLVLAIGIVVDAAIIILEAVEHAMEEGMTPYDATVEAMKVVMVPLVASALVLLAIFIPVSAMPGLVGQLYQQFGVVLSIAVVISTVVAVTLAPPLCVLILRAEKPHPFWLLRVFNQALDGLTTGYAGLVGVLSRRTLLTLALLVAVIGATVWLAKTTPQGFVPSEDTGGFFVEIMLPDAAALVRTIEVMSEVTTQVEKIPGVKSVINVSGYSLLEGTAMPNAGMMIVALHPWDMRTDPGTSQDEIMAAVEELLGNMTKAIGMAFAPPPIPGMGTGTGFEFILQDKQARTPRELYDTMNAILGEANGSEDIGAAFSTFRADVPRVRFDIDRKKAMDFGVPLRDIYTTLQAEYGGLYVNDLNIFGRNSMLYIQAEPEYRDEVDDIRYFHVRGRDGNLLPLRSMITDSKVLGPQSLVRYNMFNGVSILGIPDEGKSTGQAISRMIDIADALPPGYGYEWTGATYQELKAGSVAIFAFALAVLFAYLFLVAQFESTMIPWAIILIVPTALLGSFLYTFLAGGDVNLYTQVALVLMIGMASRNAILMVEFATVKREVEGLSIFDAAVASGRLRLRPLFMTAFSFILGVFPLVIASGAGEASRQAIGKAAFGGMLSATIIGAILTPPVFAVVQRVRESVKKQKNTDD